MWCPQITAILPKTQYWRYFIYRVPISTNSESSGFCYSRVAQGNFTPRPSQIRAWTSRFTRLLPAFLLRPHGLKTTQKEIRFLPASWLTVTSCELAHPLRSSPITGPSTLILDDPPLCSASVLSPSWAFHLSFSLNIRTTGSHVPHKSLNQVHAAFMPSTAQAVNRFPLDLSRSSASLQFWCFVTYFDTSSDGSLALVSLTLTCHDHAMTFPQRSPQGLFTLAAWGGLEPPPVQWLRGASPHLLCSYAHFISKRTRGALAETWNLWAADIRWSYMWI